EVKGGSSVMVVVVWLWIPKLGERALKTPASFGIGTLAGARLRQSRADDQALVAAQVDLALDRLGLAVGIRRDEHAGVGRHRFEQHGGRLEAEVERHRDLIAGVLAPIEQEVALRGEPP